MISSVKWTATIEECSTLLIEGNGGGTGGIAAILEQIRVNYFNVCIVSMNKRIPGNLHNPSNVNLINLFKINKLLTVPCLFIQEIATLIKTNRNYLTLENDTIYTVRNKK